ncbi:Choline transporter-like protein [Niveomyces insectorum RCEF 264]|uniref:Choline transporter-like protein n=1 Tax=Niveomyces insectorum RCEF 264 TaxID=1081102 RepID=A0A167ZTG5_9HYPO|nr:Choline transporter-like protein [Niveomyces insectorum RCEF 264]
MFSEYASRFLAQSQSRLSSFGQPASADHPSNAGTNSGADPSSRRAPEWPSSARGTRPYGRSFLGRGFGGGGGAGGAAAAAGSTASANPYQPSGSRFGQLNFAARYSAAAQDAPLFHEEDEDQEGVDDDDDDEVERDREAADLYALQRSRRVFAASRLEESSGTENDHSRASLGESLEAEQQQQHQQQRLSDSGRRIRAAAAAAAATEFDEHDEEHGEFLPKEARGRRIRSSWNGNRSVYRSGHEDEQDDEQEHLGGSAAGFDRDRRRKRSTDADAGYGSGGQMVDIGLESTIADSEPTPLDLADEAGYDNSGSGGGGGGDHPPAFQKFTAAKKDPNRFLFRRNSTGDSEVGLLHEDGSEADYAAGGRNSAVDSSGLHAASANTGATSSGAAAAAASDMELFRHDPFFAWIYLIAVASLFATFVLVYLHTSVPGDGAKKQPWGDTIYTTLLSSLHLLAVDTLVAVVVSLVWLVALRSFARYLVALILVAVPVILVAFTIYPLVSSFHGDGTGSSGFQDTVMRWASLVPAVSAVVWLYMVWKGRSALRSAVDILDFSSRILAANSALVLVGLGCLVLVVVWTWAWLAMFTRVFLGGSFSSRLSRFIISTSSWWLGIYFVLMYLWTLSVLAGVQRATTAATVSQWYFHRNVQPAPSSNEVVSAALHHAVTTIFGSICLSTLLALAVRLPLLVLPRRLAHGVGLFFYSFVPASVAALTNPLTLTYGAIHSQNLARSAQGLSQLTFLVPDAPTTTLTPRAFQARQRRRAGSSATGSGSAPLLPYRLAKLLLHATRFIMATALGFAGWVMTARQLRIALPEGSIRGSAYAYVVGLVASFIGWGVLGAMEGILSGIVDAVVICYGSETRMATNAGGAGGVGGYCMEAAYLFGGGAQNAAVADHDNGRRRRHDVY